MAFCRTDPLNEKLSSMFSSRIFTRLSIPAFSTHECAYNVKHHHHHHHDTKRSAEASRRCDRSPEQSMSSASSRASVAVTPVSQQIWWTQVVLGPAAAKHNVTELAVGPSDVACQWFGQTQPTSSLITDEVTVRGQLRWPHAGQRAVG